ncbi:MAG TPA: helix-turn-helix domain-containing protein [Lacipirellulaceae bacterium]|nr:helix-turn-helix domain-containing protein [Lacipirellulaceae bacterium]
MDSQEPDDRLQLLSVKQAAARLCCSAANVYGLIETGVLPVVRVGRHKGYRLDLRDLDAFIAERKFRIGQAASPPRRTKLKHLKL